MSPIRVGVVVIGCALAMAFAPSIATGAKPSYGCAPGFELGAYSFVDYLLLPRTEAAINDDLVTEAQILAALAVIDHNGDRVICVQLRHGDEVNSRPFGRYFYNVVDNNASVP
jgi:hypothetical protein